MILRPSENFETSAPTQTHPHHFEGEVSRGVHSPPSRVADTAPSPHLPAPSWFSSFAGFYMAYPDIPPGYTWLYWLDPPLPEHPPYSYPNPHPISISEL